MYLALPFPIFFAWFSIFIRCSISHPLNGKHLRVVWTRWKGNPKGLTGPLKGGVILETLSARFNFTYEMVRVNESLLEPPPNGRGLYSYLWENQCDLLIHDVKPTFQRIKKADHTLPWTYDRFAFIIPIADESANINAVIKPFQWPIWLGLGVSIVCVIVVLYLLQRYFEYQSKIDTLGNTSYECNDILVNLRDGRRNVKLAEQQYLYVFGNLLSQGGPCTSRLLPFRLVAGVWTLAAFIFVQAYTSSLFTYVVTPINLPIINSVYDIAHSNDINLLVREAGYINTLLLTANETGLYMTLRERLNSFEKSVCPVVSECIRLITTGSRNVYVDAKSYLNDVIRAEFKRTRKCNLQLAKEEFMSIYVSLALAKNSIYTQTISQGILEMQQIGLIDHWDLWFRPMPPQCNGKPPRENKTEGNKLSRLTLKNLTGAFIILLAGLSLSMLAFFFEKIISKLAEHQRTQLQAQSQTQSQLQESDNVTNDNVITNDKVVTNDNLITNDNVIEDQETMCIYPETNKCAMRIY